MRLAAATKSYLTQDDRRTKKAPVERLFRGGGAGLGAPVIRELPLLLLRCLPASANTSPYARDEAAGHGVRVLLVPRKLCPQSAIFQCSTDDQQGCSKQDR